MKFFILYTSFLLAPVFFSFTTNDTSSGISANSNKNIDIVTTDNDEQLSTTTGDQLKIKKRKPRLRQSEDWGRLEPEQSFQKSFAINVVRISGLERVLAVTLWSVNGKRGPPVF